MKTTNSTAVRGILCAAASGVCFGLSSVCAQFLFATYEVNSLWMTCTRMMLASILLLSVSCIRHPGEWKAIWIKPKDRLYLVLYGISLLMSQYSFMSSVYWNNAATTAVMQKLNLVLLMLLTCISTRRLPRRREITALFLALLGIFMIATGGSFTKIALTKQGLFWGLATACSVIFYTTFPRKLSPGFSQETITGFGILIGGTIINLSAKSWTMTVSLPVPGLLALLVVVVLGTVLSFSLYAQGVTDIGPVKASMLTATDPAATALLSFIWLKTTFSISDLLGFFAIVITIFLLAKKE